MSDFGLFEADRDAEQVPRRKARIAARQMTAALQTVHRTYEAYLSNADSSDNFEDRFSGCRKDIARTMIAHGVGAYPSVMREVHGSLKSAWYTKHAGEDNFEEEAGDSVDSDFTAGGDSGSDKPGGHEARRRSASEDVFEDGQYLRNAPAQQLAEGRDHSDGALLVPDAHNDPANAETSGVQRDFTPGGDTGSDAPHREAMQLVADLYTDWAQSNNLRVASMNTLDVYASNGLHDDDYYLLAGLIRKAECECDDDKDGDDDDSHSGDDTPPPHKSEGESDDSSDDSDGDSDSDSDDSDSDSGESDSDDSDDSAPDFGGADSAPAGPDDAGSDFGGEEDGDDEGGPDGFGDPAADAGGDPSAAGPPDVGAGPPDAAGQDFTVPDQAPDLPGQEMDQLQQSGPESVPPEVIDDILGLPPGTLEALIAEELNGGGGAPPSGPPSSGPPPQLASLRSVRQAAEDPTQAAGASAPAAAPAQMPAAPPAGAGSAGTMPPPGSASVAAPPAPMPLENQPAEDALLDTAVQSVTQMIDQETQEYQQIIDPLTQALQAIEFAQQVETAENPLDVTPPEGTVDADPSAAPGGADSLEQKAAAIANKYDLSVNGYRMLMTAMSRKHYEHVAEAIRTLPPELRPGIANHIGGMFHEDNPRFNNDIWLQSVGAHTASRRPFNAGENSANTQLLDAFEFPGQGAQKKGPQINDNIAVGQLPAPPKGMKPLMSHKTAAGVLDKYQQWKSQQEAQGLGYGGDQSVEGFFNTPSNSDYGQRARAEVHQVEGVPLETAGPPAPAPVAPQVPAKVGSFFTRRVPGWKWDDHLNGYISKNARAFTCSCGNQFATPSYGQCHCGKIWNSYAIGDPNHLASNQAEMFLTREIPVRKDVIMANRQMQGWTSDSGWTPPDQRDVDWVEDEDREDADAPHAPQKNARQRAAMPAADWSQTPEGGYNHPAGFQLRPENGGHQLYAPAATMGGPEVHSPVRNPGTPQEGFDFVDRATGTGPQGPSLKDRVRQHLVDRMNRSQAVPGGFAGGRSAKLKEDDYIVKYNDDEDPARAAGPKKPPSTTVKGGDPKWHSRGEQGKFKNTSPFGEGK